MVWKQNGHGLCSFTRFPGLGTWMDRRSGFQLAIYTLLAWLLALPRQPLCHHKTDNLNTNLMTLFQEVNAVVIMVNDVAINKYHILLLRRNTGPQLLNDTKSLSFQSPQTWKQGSVFSSLLSPGRSPPWTQVSKVGYWPIGPPHPLPVRSANEKTLQSYFKKSGFLSKTMSSCNH